MRFRNVWYRPLPARQIEGGTDGYLSPEATLAKCKETAAAIRQDAATLQNAANPLPEMLRLAESLEYEKDDAAFQKVAQMAGQYADSLKKLPADQLGAKKDEARHVRDCFKHMARFKVIPDDFGPKVAIEQIIKDQGWDRRR
jgi:hypothetical protein